MLDDEGKETVSKNIGGSILPSSSPEILKPLAQKSTLRPGVLQVVADEQRDTHDLFLIGDERTLLASHPNGYSCFELAKRISEQDRSGAAEQLCYIIACAGSVTAVAASMVLGISRTKGSK